MKIKRLCLLIGMLAFFTIVWVVQSSNALSVNFIKVTHLPQDQIVLLLNNSAFGYSSIQAYTLFYAIPFLILFNHFFLPNQIEKIIRGQSRALLYRQRAIRVLFISFIFSMAHTIVNLALMPVYIEYTVLNELSFPMIAVLNTFGLFFFYSFIGLIYGVVEDVVKSSVFSLFVVMLLIGSLYFIDKLGLNQAWGPLKDLVIYTKYLEHEWTLGNVFYTYMRQVMMVIFMFMIGSAVYQRKDFIS
ncbi:WxPxxD family membrane protein [Falsibacillus albus]|uniref:Uncharacterized protein n=1 Tax=Falsibacillus albus TaxID=2478915 RepID=A0A3L7JX82_9BACI|nr:WxPxxD family membrane protein [Falsibacillus albus]RLQ94884.1 hypothetical protein D9X91_12950 [Falsibacillus albus]